MIFSCRCHTGDYTADHPDKNGPPAWIESEKKQFKELRDKNGDGRLDRAEILDWIIPDDSNSANEEEAKHLLTESDANGVSFTSVVFFSLLFHCFSLKLL